MPPPPKRRPVPWQLGHAWGPENPTPPADDLPFVFVNVAMSADGKLAPATRKFQPFSSRRDRQLMFELRSYADGVMSGARTVDLNPVTLSNGGPAYTEWRLQRGLAAHPVRIVVSGRGTLNPKAAIFDCRFSPIVLLATESAPPRNLSRLQKQCDAVGVFGQSELDWAAALRWLRANWGVRTLLCEGGGEVNSGLFAGGFVQEIYLTICPVIFGGCAAPTLADGPGVEDLAAAAFFALVGKEQFEGELFLKYQAHRRSAEQRAVPRRVL